jgi:hypothetical protein
MKEHKNLFIYINYFAQTQKRSVIVYGLSFVKSKKRKVMIFIFSQKLNHLL